MRMNFLKSYGGLKMSETQNAAGRRITSLLDANSFVEIGGQVTARSTDFNLSAVSAPSDGVITGYGTVDGNLVYVYSQDVTVLNGTVGEMHARKISHIYRLARKTGAPVVAMLDCGGIRLEESTDALNALGRIYRNQALSSGVIPQITAVYGNAGGGLSILTGLSDFVFMESENARLFVNAPDAIKDSNVDKFDNTTAKFQMEQGNVDFAGSEEEMAASMRTLLAMLPLNNEDEGASENCGDDLNRATTGIASTIGNTADTLRILSDGGQFFETKPEYAKSMVTGFIKLNGYTVGAVANRGEDNALRARGVEKAADFISFCDAFNIPVLTVVNAERFNPCKCTERFMQKSGAKLAYAYANATVPKVTLVAGKAYGSAYVLMGSKAVGADLVFAWPSAEIGTMDANAAAKIIAADKDADTIKKTAEEYADLQTNVKSAARRGYVDTIIDDADTRKYVIGAFEMLYTKREGRPERKHGTV